MLLNKNLKSLKIGYGGIGIMGSAMAKHIFQNDFDLTIYNRTKTRKNYQKLLQKGVKEAKTLVELANCDIIFTCLDDEISVINFVKEILPNLRENSIIVDITTIGKKAAIKIEDILATKNCIFLDAPVTGGDKGAIAGTLTIMIGGDEKYFNYLQPVFQTFSSLIKYCGKTGSGQALKSINQLLCAINLTGVCEAFITAKEMNIEPKMIIEICGSGMAGSKQLMDVGSEITKNNFNPGFKAKHLTKDLRLLLEGIENDKLPMTRKIFNDFQDLIKDDNWSEMGTQILLKYLEKS
ncbi:MAG: 3-hydroxyisobutyrate dehydrogenase [Rickettsiales bacterium]|jgi:3-hydroxyisobutyrate dehydrogenase